MDIIIAHPNGWGTREQGVLRTAAVQAGLTTATRYNRQISFVSEAEASVQFCLSSSRTTSSLNPGMNLVVCDAGGSTVDTTVYKVTAVEPMLELEEIKSSACIQAGAIFVDDAAEQYLREQFEDAGLDDDDVDTYTKDGLDHFTSFIKPNFNGTEETLDIKVGKRKLNLPSINVQGGRMKLTRAKAVADGAAIWAVARSVVCRATRYSYGIEIARPYNKRNSQHTGRKKLYWPSGTYHVKGGWSQIVAKDMVISYDSSIKQPYGQEYYTLSEIPSKISVTIYATTLSADYEFMCNEDGLVYDGWSVVCKVSANLEDLGSIAVKKYSPSTGSYWVLNYNIAILFGGTQLSAYIEWVQNGRTMTGPATVIPAALK
ncbi:hypothetical protein FRC10_004991 [Ceratobasidium sp. 414]|nr:hypothetical protein FRC10_004991 [Ceratobasidium sp. 414]